MDKWCKVTVEEEYKKNPSLTEDMVTEMRTWLTNQPHLPQSLSDMDLIFQIVSSDYDLNETKKALDVNYTLRTKLILFNNRDPYSKEMQLARKCMFVTRINNVDDEGSTAIIIKVNDSDTAQYSFHSVMRDCMMTADQIRLERGTRTGMVAIVDTDQIGFGHILKAPPGQLHALLKYSQEGMPLTIKSIHMINTRGSIIDKIMAIIRPFINKNLSRKISLHSGYETIYEHNIRREKMPQEYGGSAGPIEQLTYEAHENLKEFSEYFKEEEKLRVDESKRLRNKFLRIF